MTYPVLLELKDVNKTYTLPSKEKVQAVKKISFKIKQGSFTIIIGPSGSGKSTLLKMAGLIQEPSRGSVIFKDQETNQLTPNERAHHIKENMAFIFPHSNLLSYLNLMENVMLPMSNPDPEKALKILNKLGLNDSHICPQKLSSLEKQKAALARAMINNPSLILLDEPTRCLGRDDAQKYLNILKNFKKRFSLLLVTDNQQQAHYADEVHYMEDGILKGKVINNF